MRRIFLPKSISAWELAFTSDIHSQSSRVYGIADDIGNVALFAAELAYAHLFIQSMMSLRQNSLKCSSVFRRITLQQWCE
jgi:hypothetical protein